MNIVQSFVDFLESNNVATFGQDLFIGGAPSSNKVPDTIYWAVGRGGTVVSANQTGEKVKEYIIELYMRDRDYQTVYDAMQELEELLNCANCVELDGYELIDIHASLMFVDEDLDNEDRKLGMIQVNATTHKACIS